MTVVLLHALMMSAEMWAGPRRALERAGHRVLAPDQRGYGATPLGSAPPSLAVAADELAEFLDAQGIRAATLVGCSMGGYLAMAFLRRHPGRVGALGLLATRAEADDAATVARREAFASGILKPAHRISLNDSTIPMLVGPHVGSEVLARVTELVYAASPEVVAWSQRAIAARPDSSDVLRDLTAPSVVIAGEEDRLVTLAEHQRLADALPNGELRTLPGAGHLTPMEAPDEVAAAIGELVGRSG